MTTTAHLQGPTLVTAAAEAEVHDQMLTNLVDAVQAAAPCPTQPWCDGEPYTCQPDSDNGGEHYRRARTYVPLTDSHTNSPIVNSGADRADRNGGLSAGAGITQDNGPVEVFLHIEGHHHGRYYDEQLYMTPSEAHQLAAQLVTAATLSGPAPIEVGCPAWCISRPGNGDVDWTPPHTAGGWDGDGPDAERMHWGPGSKVQAYTVEYRGGRSSRGGVFVGDDNLTIDEAEQLVMDLMSAVASIRAAQAVERLAPVRMASR